MWIAFVERSTHISNAFLPSDLDAGAMVRDEAAILDHQANSAMEACEQDDERTS